MRLLVLCLCVTSYAATCFALAVKRDLRCGSNTPLTTNNGVITSHAGYDFGHHYGKNLNCIWTITAPVGKFVELVAENFSVSYHSTLSGLCNYDYLELYDGDSINSPSMGKFCGSSFLPISSTGNSLTLRFHTNSGAQYAGFRFHYNFTDSIVRSCPHHHFQCDNGYCLTSNSYRCDGDDDCGDDSDERNCTALLASLTCDAHHWPCPGSRKCILNSWVCDGDNDCHDGLRGSDESFSLCGGTYRTHRFTHTTFPSFTFPVREDETP